MKEIVDSYIGEEFRYEYESGPSVVRSRDDAIRYGVNCIALAHLVLNDMAGIELPSELDLYELYSDSEYTRKLDVDESITPGDIVWFGRNVDTASIEDFTPEYNGSELVNWDEFPVRHVGIVAVTSSMEPIIIHATSIDKSTSLWPISRFRDIKRYRQVHGVDRLKAA